MKKFYEEIKIQLHLFDDTDILTTSPNASDDAVDDIFAPNS